MRKKHEKGKSDKKTFVILEKKRKIVYNELFFKAYAGRKRTIIRTGQHAEGENIKESKPDEVKTK